MRMVTKDPAHFRTSDWNTPHARGTGINCDFTAQTTRVQTVLEAFAVYTSEFAVNVEGKPKKRLELNEAAFKKHVSLRAVSDQMKRSHLCISLWRFCGSWRAPAQS